VCLSDTWPLFDATRHPAFNQHLLWEQPRSEWEVYRRVEAIVEATQQGKMASVSAVLKTTGAWVSLFRFQQPAGDAQGVPDHTLEMGLWTHADYWHGRFSLELGRMCVDAAFQQPGVEHLIGITSTDNRSSQQLMQLVGLHLQPQQVQRTGESGPPRPSLVFEVDRATWLRQRRAQAFSAYERQEPPSPERSMRPDSATPSSASGSSWWATTITREPEPVRPAAEVERAPSHSLSGT
jgi:RimJ/RimL family protein N-acetyltransferase